jgi:putative pyruvate formate lyase activating enzyme
MPDFKYANAETAKRYSGVGDYPTQAKTALREMHRQVGDLALDGRGVARRGLLVRHLVLPNDLAGTMEVVTFLAQLSPNTYLNVMGQYRPCYGAYQHPPLARRPTGEEMKRAVYLARAAGLHRLDGFS